MTTTQPEPASSARRSRRTAQSAPAPAPATEAQGAWSQLLARATQLLDPQRKAAFSAADVLAGREVFAAATVRVSERALKLDQTREQAAGLVVIMRARREGLDQGGAARSTIEVLEPQEEAFERAREELRRAQAAIALSTGLAALEPAARRADELESALSLAEARLTAARAEARTTARALAEQEARGAEREAVASELTRLAALGDVLDEHARCLGAVREADERLSSLAASCQEARATLEENRAEVAGLAAKLRDASAAPERADEWRTRHEAVTQLLHEVQRLAELRQFLRQSGGRQHLLQVATEERAADIKELTLELHAARPEPTPEDPRHARLAELVRELAELRATAAAEAEALIDLRHEMLTLSDLLGPRAYSNVAELQASVDEAASALGLGEPGGPGSLADLDKRIRDLRRKEGSHVERLTVAERTLAAAMEDRARHAQQLHVIEAQLPGGVQAGDPRAQVARLEERLRALDAALAEARAHASEAAQLEAGRRAELEAARAAQSAASEARAALQAEVTRLRRDDGFATDAERAAAVRTPAQMEQLRAEIKRFETVLADARRRAQASAEASDLAWPDVAQVELLSALVSHACGWVQAERAELQQRLTALELVVEQIQATARDAPDSGEPAAAPPASA